MPDIHIERHHTLGLAKAREVAHEWVLQAERDYGLECVYEEGDACDVAKFTRTGIDGDMEVTGNSFRLRAALGFLYGSFSEQIEQRLQRNLDNLLGTGTAVDNEEDGYNDKDWK